MCLMAPARVVAVDGTLCEVETSGRVDRASMMLEPDLQVGDWVLVNGGTVVRKLEPEQAEEMTRAFGIVFGLTDESGEPLPGDRVPAGQIATEPAIGAPLATEPAAGAPLATEPAVGAPLTEPAS